MRCSSYSTAEKYNFEKLLPKLKKEKFNVKIHEDILHISTSDLYDSKIKGDIFFFSYGCVVFWGFCEKSEKKLLKLVKTCEIKPARNFTDDIMQFQIDSEQETRIDEETDTIILESDDYLLKLAISFAMCQTVVLDIFEESVKKTIEETKYISEQMSKTGKVSISKNKLAIYIGKLFAERNLINLHSDILDIPEFFWKKPKYEQYYLLASESFDIDQRHNILNRRLDVIHDLYAKLSDELNFRHSSNLEVTIIILIAIEIAIAIFRDFLNWF